MIIDLEYLVLALDVNPVQRSHKAMQTIEEAARAYLDMAKSSRRDPNPSQLTDDEVDLIAKSKMPDPADRSQNTEY